MPNCLGMNAYGKVTRLACGGDTCALRYMTKTPSYFMWPVASRCCWRDCHPTAKLRQQCPQVDIMSLSGRALAERCLPKRETEKGELVVQLCVEEPGTEMNAEMLAKLCGLDQALGTELGSTTGEQEIGRCKATQYFRSCRLRRSHARQYRSKRNRHMK